MLLLFNFYTLYREFNIFELCIQRMVKLVNTCDCGSHIYGFEFRYADIFMRELLVGQAVGLQILLMSVRVTSFAP